jgi:hypothetical protein
LFAGFTDNYVRVFKIVVTNWVFSKLVWVALESLFSKISLNL